MWASPKVLILVLEGLLALLPSQHHVILSHSFTHMLVTFPTHFDSTPSLLRSWPKFPTASGTFTSNLSCLPLNSESLPYKSPILCTWHEQPAMYIETLEGDFPHFINSSCCQVALQFVSILEFRASLSLPAQLPLPTSWFTSLQTPLFQP